MELRHEFTVPVPVDEAWRALLDIEGIAPCLPGATVEEYDGKTVTGSVKVKLGPVTVSYKGTAVFEELDEAAHRLVLTAGGRETRGQGTARAAVTGTLTERGTGTAVTVVTDLTVTGRPAQFGRGVLAEVGDRLVGQFADCLARRLAGPPAQAPQQTGGEETGSEEPGREEPGHAPEPVADRPEKPAGQPASGADAAARTPAGTGGTYEETEPLDLLGAAGVPVAKRAAVAAGAVAAVALLVVWVRRLRRR